MSVFYLLPIQQSYAALLYLNKVYVLIFIYIYITPKLAGPTIALLFDYRGDDPEAQYGGGHLIKQHRPLSPHHHFRKYFHSNLICISTGLWGHRLCEFLRDVWVQGAS